MSQFHSKFFQHGRGWLTGLSGAMAVAMAAAQTTLPQATQPTLSPLVRQGQLGEGWRYVGFPKQKADIPPTLFLAGTVDGQEAMEVRTASSYGTLVHTWAGPAPGKLSWRWRLDQRCPRDRLGGCACASCAHGRLLARYARNHWPCRA